MKLSEGDRQPCTHTDNTVFSEFVNENSNLVGNLSNGSAQTGVLWLCALLESVASSVKNMAELRLSSLTDCLCPGPGKGTLLTVFCTSLVFGGTSVVLEGTSLVFKGTLLALEGALSAFGGTSPVFGGTSVVFGCTSLGEWGSEELVVITETGLASLEELSETSELRGGTSDSLFRGDPFFWGLF